MTGITRRAFLGASAGAAAGLLLRRTAGGRGRGAAGAGPAPAFTLGLASYTCREFDLDATLAMAERVGLMRIALKDVHLPLDSPPETVRAAAAKVRAAGFALYGCGVVYMTTEYEVDRAFGYARSGGMGVIIGVPEHGLLGRVEAKVRETDIRLAIHNHGPGDRRYPTPRSILDLVGRLDPRIGVCLDVGHCQRSGVDPSEAAAACGPRLLDVHLKDVTASTEAGVAVEAGRGVVDLPRFLRTLAAMGFEGTAAFEYEKDGRDPLAGLAESVGYVRGVLAGSDGPVNSVIE
jgi:sugar phosphate isomerase/epimerase